MENVMIKQVIIKGVRYRSVKGMERYIQIGENGLVRRLQKLKGVDGHTGYSRAEKFLKGGLNSHKYRVVRVHINGISTTVYPHKLVAQAFLGYRMDGSYASVVNHKDGCALNNSLDNLEVTTHRRNVSHGYEAKSTTSKYVGVFWNSQKLKWCSKFSFKGKESHIGFFNDEYCAYLEYKKVIKPYDAIECRKCNMFGFDIELLKEIRLL